MRNHSAKLVAGFSLLEFALVVLLLSLFAGVLLERVLFYQEQAEKAALEQTVVALRSALMLQIAERLPKGRETLQSLIEGNPMEWLERKPDGYLGDRFGPAPGPIPGHSWYFDLRDKSLVYVVASHQFAVSNAGRRQIRYQVRSMPNKPQVGVTGVDKFTVDGLSLVLLEPYQWF